MQPRRAVNNIWYSFIKYYYFQRVQFMNIFFIGHQLPVNEDWCISKMKSACSTPLSEGNVLNLVLRKCETVAQNNKSNVLFYFQNSIWEMSAGVCQTMLWSSLPLFPCTCFKKIPQSIIQLRKHFERIHSIVQFKLCHWRKNYGTIFT